MISNGTPTDGPRLNDSVQFAFRPILGINWYCSAVNVIDMFTLEMVINSNRNIEVFNHKSNLLSFANQLYWTETFAGCKIQTLDRISPTLFSAVSERNWTSKVRGHSLGPGRKSWLFKFDSLAHVYLCDAAGPTQTCGTTLLRHDINSTLFSFCWWSPFTLFKLKRTCNTAGLVTKSVCPLARTRLRVIRNQVTIAVRLRPTQRVKLLSLRSVSDVI